MATPKDPSFHRKLAAILAADVVGYSRMMEADEGGTLRLVQSTQKTCITPITASYGGRLVKTTGDGFLFEFSSAVDAILFALAFQKRLQAAMASVEESKRLIFRVGVHAGDVLSDGIDMFGDGVNVAARLETLSTSSGSTPPPSTRPRRSHRVTPRSGHPGRGDRSQSSSALSCFSRARAASS